MHIVIWITEKTSKCRVYETSKLKDSVYILLNVYLIHSTILPNAFHQHNNKYLLIINFTCKSLAFVVFKFHTKNKNKNQSVHAKKSNHLAKTLKFEKNKHHIFIYTDNYLLKKNRAIQILAYKQWRIQRELEDAGSLRRSKTASIE